MSYCRWLILLICLVGCSEEAVPLDDTPGVKNEVKEEGKTGEESSLEKRVEVLLKEGRKIEAIRVYRAETGVGLKEAKEAVDEMDRRLDDQ